MIVKEVLHCFYADKKGSAIYRKVSKRTAVWVGNGIGSYNNRVKHKNGRNSAINGLIFGLQKGSYS